MWTISPLWFLMAPPIPTIPGLPLEAPSKFNLRQSSGGCFHLWSCEEGWALFPPEGRMLEASSWNFFKMRRSCPVGLSFESILHFSCTSYLILIIMDSFAHSMLWLSAVKIRRFLSFHIVHVMNPGVHFHMLSTLLILEKFLLQFVIEPWMESLFRSIAKAGTPTHRSWKGDSSFPPPAGT